MNELFNFFHTIGYVFYLGGWIGIIIGILSLIVSFPIYFWYVWGAVLSFKSSTLLKTILARLGFLILALILPVIFWLILASTHYYPEVWYSIGDWCCAATGFLLCAGVPSAIIYFVIIEPYRKEKS